MEDLRLQIEELRRRMAQASARAEEQTRKQAEERRAEAAERRERAARELAERVSGRVAETPHGMHLECERLWRTASRHGRMQIGELAGLPADLFQALSDGEARSSPPEEWVFLDTETTGLAGGSGTCAFLIGVGRITGEGFRLRQFFLRDFAEEPSALFALQAELESASTLVTYNGRAFDVPLLETRYRMHRTRPPFSALAHVDLLSGARRVWRFHLDSCRLVELEREIIGFEREGDIPGEMIPQAYFDYLRGNGGGWLAQVFEHNALDIVTLACLCGVLPQVFASPEPGALRHGTEMVGLGRWLWKSGRHEEALALFREAVTRKLKDDLLYRTMWDIAALERKRGRMDAAVALWAELAGVGNPHQGGALVELAKHYEHREKNPALALEFARQALGLEASEELRKRCGRLERQASRATPRRLI